MSFILVVAAVLSAVWSVKRLVALHHVLRARFYRQRFWTVAEGDVPPHVREALGPTIADVLALGFEVIEWGAVQRRNESDEPRYHARLVHQAERAYAAVSMSGVPDPEAIATVTFTSLGADGRVVRTADGGEQSWLGDPPGTIVIEPWAATIAAQWDAHRAALRQAALTPAICSDAEAFAQLVERGAAHVESLIASRALVPASPALRSEDRRDVERRPYRAPVLADVEAGGAYVVSWPVALRATRRILRAAPILAKQRMAKAQAWRAALRPFPVVPIEADVSAYGLVAEINDAPARASFRVALFALTLPLSLLASWYALGSLRMAVTVIFVIALHELGHVVAMRAYGYRDVSIFFIPFFGGAAIGQKEKVPVGQEVVVLLAGPVPGLVLGLGLALAGARVGAIGTELAWVLIGVNVFNLLPLLPLDGGRIAHVLLFARLPWVEVIARAAAAFAMLVAGVSLNTWPLTFLGAILVLTLPKAYREARARRRLAAAADGAAPGASTLFLLFRALREDPLGARPFAERYQLVRQALAGSLLSEKLGLRARLAWLGAYAAAIGVACAGTALALTRGIDKPALAETSREPMPALACPATEVVAAKEAPRDSFYVGIGEFREGADVDAARARITAALPHATVAPLGSTLIIWSSSMDDDEELGLFAHENEGARRDATRDAIASAVRASGGRFVARSPVSVECRAVDESAAVAIEQVLAEQRALDRAAVSAPAPWDPQPELTDSQKLARRTLRLVSVDRTGYEASDFPPWWKMMFEGRKAARARVEEHHMRLARRVEDAAAAARAQGPIDEEVSRIMVAKVRGGAGSDHDHEVLLDRLGITEARRTHRGWYGDVARAGDHVRVTVDVWRPQNFEQTTKPMLAWLCARSCGGLRWSDKWTRDGGRGE